MWTARHVQASPSLFIFLFLHTHPYHGTHMALASGHCLFPPYLFLRHPFASFVQNEGDGFMFNGGALERATFFHTRDTERTSCFLPSFHLS